MAKSFNNLPRLIQIILLLIPGVNWVVEIIVRWSDALSRGSVLRLLIAILVTFTGFFIGWLDAIWCLLFHHNDSCIIKCPTRAFFILIII